MMEGNGNKKQNRMGHGIKKEDMSDIQYHWPKERSIYT